MIPRYCPNFDFEEFKMLFSDGKNITEIFEEEFSKLTDSKYAISFPSGRASLYSIFKSLNISNGEIIIPSFSCVAVPVVILETDNIPIFVDISLEDYNMKLDDVIKKVNNKTKAIIPTYMYGYPWDTKKLREQINENIIIIEDAALALTTKDVGKYGDIQFYSFGIYKPLYTFKGGIITTNNYEYYEKIKKFRDERYCNSFFYDNLRKFFILIISLICYRKCFYDVHNIYCEDYNQKFYSKHLDISEMHIHKDYFKSFSKCQAKVGVAQIKKLKNFIRKRKQIASLYNKELSDINNIILPPIIEGATFTEYTVRIKNRNKFVEFLQNKGIQVNTLFQYSLPHLSSFKDYVKDEYKNSLIASKEVVNLPSYPRLLKNPNNLNHIVNTIHKYS
jgi:dTDP-4-amino-4,6-dideoxygalactose transaminase